MDALRLSLLFIGLIIVGGVYLASRRLYRKENRSSPFQLLFSNNFLTRVFRTKEPVDYQSNMEVDEFEDSLDTLNISSSESLDEELEADINIKAVDGEEPSTTAGEFLLVLRILTNASENFSGSDIVTAAESAGMEYGEMGIFHLYSALDDESLKTHTPVCSLANGVEPGTFDIPNMDSFSTPGLTLFMQLPGPIDGRDAFDKTLEAGRIISEYLGGELCDESRSVVTAQTVSHLKEKLESYRFKRRMAQIKKRHQL